MSFTNQIRLVGNFVHELLSCIDDSTNSRINAAANACIKPLEWVFASTHESHLIKHYTVTRKHTTEIPQETTVARWKIAVGYMTFIPATIVAIGLKTAHSVVNANNYTTTQQKMHVQRYNDSSHVSTLTTRITTLAVGSFALTALFFLPLLKISVISGFATTALGCYKSMKTKTAKPITPEPTSPTHSEKPAPPVPIPDPAAPRPVRKGFEEPATALPDMGKSYEVYTGLHNPGFNTCWLNAVLKFISATDYYDSMLMTRRAEPDLEELRVALDGIIGEIRTKSVKSRGGNLPMVDFDAYMKLIEIIRKNFNHIPFSEFYLAEDFLNELVERFKFTPGSANFFTESTSYTPIEHNVDKKTDTARDWKFTLYFEPNEERALRTVIEERTLPINQNNKKYSVKHTFTKCPNNLFFSKDTFGYLKLSTNGFVTLDEAAPGLPKKRIWYKVAAAITNQRNAHFYCNIRDPDGTLRIHDDGLLYPFSTPQKAEAELQRDACVLLLRKFAEKIIDA